MPAGSCRHEETEPRQSSRRGVDDEFLPILSGVGRILPQVWEELESGDQLELGWVWLGRSSSGGGSGCSGLEIVSLSPTACACSAGVWRRNWSMVLAMTLHMLTWYVADAAALLPISGDEPSIGKWVRHPGHFMVSAKASSSSESPSVVAFLIGVGVPYWSGSHAPRAHWSS